jgi:ubiquinone/menaquinone biosynthesis C-methylase UbiE
MSKPDTKSTMMAFDAVADMYAWRWYSPEDSVKFHIATHRVRRLLRFASVNEDDLVLEIGCGIGVPRILDDISLRLYVGLDVSRRMMETRLKSQENWIHWIVADAQHLPFCGKVFQKAISIETIEHLADPNLALCEMMRVIQSNGIVAISVPSRFSSKVFNRVLRLFETIFSDDVRSKMSRILTRNMIESQFSRSDFVKMFQLSGAKDVRTERIGFFIPYRTALPFRVMLLLERVIEFTQLPICACILVKGKIGKCG